MCQPGAIRLLPFPLRAEATGAWNLRPQMTLIILKVVSPRTPARPALTLPLRNLPNHCILFTLPPITLVRIKGLVADAAARGPSGGQSFF